MYIFILTVGLKAVSNKLFILL